MSKMYSQIREVEIAYEDKATSSESTEQKVYKIDYDTIDINFDIKFTNDKKSNICTIDLYNLSKNTMDNIKPESSIRVRAGYKDFSGYIFNGKIDYCYKLKSGDDVVFKIICSPDAKSWNSQFINKSWNRGVKAQDIVNQIIQIAGWQIGDIDVGELKYNGGKTFRKQARLCLQEIANDANLTLYFNNGNVYMYPKGKVVKKKITVSPMNGLIDFPTKNIKQKKKEETYTIKTALRYDYTEDTIIVVKDSDFIEPVELKIINGHHKASDNDFYTELECQKLTDIKTIVEDYDDADVDERVNEIVE